MKKLVLAVVCCLFALSITAQTGSKSKKIIIIEGHFFNEIPVSKKNLAKVYFLKTPKGTSAMGIELSEQLPEKALKYAVPKEQIPEGELLLEYYKEKVEAAEGVSFKVIKGNADIEEGDRFPEFAAKDIGGRTWTNDDFKGKVMVLNLWYTGCGPCRAEMPELSTWKDEMPDVMFFSSTYESAKRAQPVLEAQKFNWIPLVNDRQFKDLIGLCGYPITIVVDKNGVIAKIVFGTSSVQREELKEKIKQLR